MMSADENTPGRAAGKNGKASPPAKKNSKRNRKPAQQAAPEPMQVEQLQETITEAAAVLESPPVDMAADAPAAAAPAEHLESPSVDTTADASAAAAPAEHLESPAVDTTPYVPTAATPAAHAEAAPVSLQTITNAYGDFTRKSIEQTSSFFVQLAGVRSLGRAFELQGEFAKQSCETFFSESRKIRELHNELAMQRWRELEGFVAKLAPPRFM